MSFYQKSLPMWLVFYIFTPLFLQQVLAQPVSIVSISEWGSNSYEDAVELDGYYYFAQANSRKIEVYGSLDNDISARLGSISFDETVFRLFKFNGLLVVVDDSSLKLYEVDGLENPKFVYGISIEQGSSSEGATFSTNDNKLAYLSSDHRVSVLQVDDNEYSILNIYSLDIGETTYDRASALGFYGDNLYVGVSYETYESEVWTDQLLVAKLSLENDFNISIEYEEDTTDNRISELHYLKDGAFIASRNYNNEVQVYGINQASYDVIEEISVIGYGNVLFSHYGNNLWLFDGQNLQRYDMTDLSSITLIEGISVGASSYQYSYFHKLFKTTSHLIALADNAVLAVELDGEQYVADDEVFYLGGNARKVAVSNNKLYIPISSRVDVVDISSLNEPSLISQLKVNEQSYVGNLYKLDEGLLSTPSDDLVYFDLSSEGAPTYNFGIDTDQSLYRSILANNRLYVFNDDQQIVRFNVSDENSLYELSYSSEVMTELLEYTDRIAVSGDYMAVAGYGSEYGYRLQLIGDISETITFLSTVDLDYYPRGLVAFDDYIYVADDNRLNVYSLENESLNWDNFFEVGFYVSRVDIFEEFLLVYHDYNGITTVSVYDLTTPSTPTLLSSTALEEGLYIYSHSEVTYEGSNIFITEYSEQGKVLILQLNRAPVLDFTEYSLDEDTSLTIELSELDPEQEQVQIDLLTEPENGTLTYNEELQTLVYQPSDNYYGEDSATIKILDPHDNFIESDIKFSVAAVNDAPSFVSTSIEATEGLTTVVSSIASDIDNDTLTYEIITEPTEGSAIISEEGVLSFTSSSDFSGDTSITVSISDGLGEPVQQTITISVQDVNDAPNIVESVVTINEDAPETLALTINDPEGHNFELEVVSFSDGIFSAEAIDSELNIVPQTNFNGETSVLVRVTDELELSAEFTIDVIVSSVNDLPAFTVSNTSIVEDTSLTLSELITDVDGDVLTLTITEAPSNGVFEVLDDNTATFTPNLNFYGVVEVGLSVSDGVAEAVTHNLIIEVTAVNDAPSIGTLAFEMDEDTNSELVLDISDVENELVTLTVVEFSDGISNVEVLEDSKLLVTPLANYFGQAAIKINLMDENQASQDYTLTVNIVAVDDMPEAVEINAEAIQGTNYNGALPTEDLDGEALTYSMVTAAINGTVTLESNGAYTYLPNSSFTGSDSFTYSVSDGSGNTVEGKINFSVRARSVVEPVDSNNSGGGGSLAYLTLFLLLVSFWRLGFIHFRP